MAISRPFWVRFSHYSKFSEFYNYAKLYPSLKYFRQKNGDCSVFTRNPDSSQPNPNGHLGSDFHKIRIVRGLIVIHTISKFEANRKKKTNFDETEMAATGGHLGSDSHQIQILLKLISHIHYIQV